MKMNMQKAVKGLISLNLWVFRLFLSMAEFNNIKKIHKRG